MERRRASRRGADGLLLGAWSALGLGPPGAASAPAQYAVRSTRQMRDATSRAVTQNASCDARLAAEHSPLTHNRRALWPAVQSNEAYLTL